MVAIYLQVVAVLIDGQGAYAGAFGNAAKQPQRIALRTLVREALPFFATEPNDPVHTDSHLDDPSSSQNAHVGRANDRGSCSCRSLLLSAIAQIRLCDFYRCVHPLLWIGAKPHLRMCRFVFLREERRLAVFT